MTFTLPDEFADQFVKRVIGIAIGLLAVCAADEGQWT